VTKAVVCGVDGSSEAQAAATVAGGLARRLGLRLVVVHVVQFSLEPGAGLPGARLVPVGATLEAELAAGERLLEELVREAGLADAERRVVWGFPADRLADVADEEDAELLVVGSRGRGAFKAAFLGSVSSELVGVARRPVVVVPPGG
jgi:nucleotide-binding universal stress UspA family protein